MPGRILVKPKPHLSEAEFSRRANSHSALHRGTLVHANVRVLVVAAEQTETVLAALQNDPDIEFAEHDYLAHSFALPNDPYVVAGNEWHLTKIQAIQAWSVTAGASSVVIAILDSGVNTAHPDLVGRILPGYDFVNSDTDAADDYGHGTAVAGTVTAAGNNGVGVAGVAYGCMLLPVKVMDALGSASHSTIAQGIEYAVQQGARIINLSLGGDWPSSTLQNAINFAWSNNVIVVAAAGNNGSTVPQYPAACDHVLAVASSEPDDSRSWFSSYGSYVTLFAPGDNIWTTQRDLNNPYGAWSGTSFSSPVVAGVAALVLSVNPTLSNSQILDVLKQSADDLGPAGYDATYAYGRVNAFRAVSAVSPSIPSSSPEVLPPVEQPPTGTLVNTNPPAETVVPSLTLLSAPPNGARLKSPIITLAGIASDNAGLARVDVQVNDLPSQPAEGTSNWTAQVMLSPGYNVIHLRSVDLAGNVSREIIRGFTYVVTAPLSVQTNGLGAVVPNLDGRQLEVGKTYRIRAIPCPGQVFAGWLGGLASDSPTLTFTMQTNLALVANFVTNPFPVVRGFYSGLVTNASSVTPDNSGYFALAITRSGYFSGRLDSAGQRSGFSGRFNLSGDASINVRRGLTAPLSLGLHVDLANVTDNVSGSLSDGIWVSSVAGSRNVFNAWSNPAQQAGLRSFVLERAQDSETAAAGLSRIFSSGATSVRGKLNDGRAFSASSALAKNGDCPFYLSLNRGAEIVIGWLNFAAGQGPTASGTVLWVKTGTNSFATTLQATPGQ